MKLHIDLAAAYCIHAAAHCDHAQTHIDYGAAYTDACSCTL